MILWKLLEVGSSWRKYFPRTFSLGTLFCSRVQLCLLFLGQPEEGQLSSRMPFSHDMLPHHWPRNSEGSWPSTVTSETIKQNVSSFWIVSIWYLSSQQKTLSWYQYVGIKNINKIWSTSFFLLGKGRGKCSLKTHMEWVTSVLVYLRKQHQRSSGQ